MTARFLSNLKISKFSPSISHSRAWYCQKRRLDYSLASATEPKDLAKFYNGLSQFYNSLNDVSMFGLHRKWRKTLLNSINVTDQTQILDLAGGTGANTIRLLKKCKHFSSDSKFSIILYDLSPEMIKIAKTNSKKLNYNPKFLQFIQGDMHKLPFDNNSFDTIILFFAIRRQIDFGVVFKEVNRVLKPQGKFLVGDFCYSKNPTLIQRLYCNYYIQYIVAGFEKLFFGKLQASLFLVKDIHSILSKDEIRTLLEESNFQNIQFKSLSLGIAGLTSGYKA